MDDVGQENSGMPEMMTIIFTSFLLIQPILILASDKKKVMPVMTASASFLHYKLIHTKVYKIKTHIPAKIEECFCEVHKPVHKLFPCILFCVLSIISSIFSLFLKIDKDIP
jgi:hypothetical protein